MRMATAIPNAMLAKWGISVQSASDKQAQLCSAQAKGVQEQHTCASILQAGSILQYQDAVMLELGTQDP